MSKKQNKTKKFTPTVLKKIDKKWDEKIEVVIEDHLLKIDKYFRETKINDFIMELVEKIKLCQKEGGNISEFAFTYYPILMIKHFTDLFDGLKNANDLSLQLQVLNELIDNNLLSVIIEKMPKEEQQKINDKVIEMTQNVDLFVNDFSDEVSKMQLKNDDVIQLKDWVDKIKKEKNINKDNIIEQYKNYYKVDGVKKDEKNIEVKKEQENKESQDIKGKMEIKLDSDE